MAGMGRGVTVILIGGTSHTGKSTLGRLMAERLGCPLVHTDRMGRHPGRPWPQEGRPVPDHVATHYLSFSTDELIADVRRYYHSRRTAIEAAVAEAGPEGLVIEGSALSPDHAAGLEARTLWLTAGAGFLRRRIETESGHAAAGVRQRAMIEAFIARAVAFDRAIIAEAQSRGQPVLRVDEAVSTESLLDEALSLAAQ